MAHEPTELDKRRGAYTDQIVAHVKNVADNTDADVRFLVDNLLLEWGGDAYRQGMIHVAERITKYASEFIRKPTTP